MCTHKYQQLINKREMYINKNQEAINNLLALLNSILNRNYILKNETASSSKLASLENSSVKLLIFSADAALS